MNRLPLAVGEPAGARPPRVATLPVVRALVGLLARPTLAETSAWALPVTALAVVSALTLSVAGGVHWFFGTTGQLAPLYRVFAVVALVVLVVPLMTLAGAAARLAATRRDRRLSSLRLLGASSAVLRLVTLAENAATAVAGAVLGVVGYLALMPLLGLLHFSGQAIGPTGLWLGAGWVLAAGVGIVLVVLASAAVGLRRVEVSPLGVRTRQRAARAGAWRLAAGVGGLVVAGVLGRFVGATGSMLVAGVVCVVMFALPLLAVNQLGPWVVQRLARAELGRARGPVALLAARATLEDPKLAWRQVGALSVSSFVAVLAGTAVALSQSTAHSATDRLLLADIRTGVLVTLAISFVTVAAGVGINQAAAVLDRRELFVGLDMVGMPADVIDAARRRAVLRPLLAVVGIGVGSAVVLVLPLGAAGKAVQPSSLALVAGVLVVGVGLVRLALASTRLALGQVLAAGLVRVE